MTINRRRLGLVENLFATLHSLNSMLYVNIAHIQGTPDKKVLRHAVNLIQERHPLLRVHIRNLCTGQKLKTYTQYLFESSCSPDLLWRWGEKSDSFTILLPL